MSLNKGAGARTLVPNHVLGMYMEKRLTMAQKAPSEEVTGST